MTHFLTPPSNVCTAFGHEESLGPNFLLSPSSREDRLERSAFLRNNHRIQKYARGLDICQAYNTNNCLGENHCLTGTHRCWNLFSDRPKGLPNFCFRFWKRRGGVNTVNKKVRSFDLEIAIPHSTWHIPPPAKKETKKQIQPLLQGNTN